MILSEKNITLRPLTEEDTKPMALLANNRNIWNNVRDLLPSPYTEKDAETFIHLVKEETAQTKFAIDYKKQFCGVIGLVPQQDVYKMTAEIGYWIGEPFWSKGIATVAVKLITDYGLHTLGFNRIHTGVFEYNIGSMRVLEKNGYGKDGIFKKSIFKNGKIWNEHRFSIIQ